ELVAFDASGSSGAECLTLAQRLARVANACLAASARAISRAAECGVVDRPADVLARAGGGTLGAARAMLETVDAVGDLPATDAALRSGEISLAQAEEIVSMPAHEQELLALARSSGLGPVRDRARKARMAARDPKELYKNQQESREFRHWRDKYG